MAKTKTRRVDTGIEQRGDSYRFTVSMGYDKNGKQIIHRVIEVKEVGNIKYYYTKGDANNVGDNIALTFEDIKAKVVLIVPFIGYPNILIEECKRGL